MSSAPTGRPLPAEVAPRAGDPEITDEVVADHGLSPDEYEKVRAIMGRTPTWTELGVFSAMWSEHCGYKNSKRLLKTLPTQAPWVIKGPGENAGVIDVGDGYALAFKIESHNHPSAVEPYQGAATGVGGILRDIFTMGARPIAVLDSLRFGDLDSARVRYLFGGVVKGVGDYGNCVGIPNIGGEVQFDAAYEGNPLVNAMCLGLMKHEELITGVAEGVGNPLMAVGARTGRDGIHGATFASEELSEDADESSRPMVQVGDPFTEKLLLEASLELIASGHITGIQDMGAAGLTSSATEMAGRAGNGVEIDTALVPVREVGMTPYEILLSESQERMLVTAKAGHEDDVRRILEKWELEAEVVGRVTDDGMFRVKENGVTVAEIPNIPLTEECPTYEREGIEALEVAELRDMELPVADPLPDPSLALLDLMRSPNIASKRWIFRQYDTTVRTSTVRRPGGDAGAVRIRGTRRAVAATTDCNGRYVYLDPRNGARAAVAEAARNLVCVGALPTAVTNNLNFGNPLKPPIYYQLREAVRGLGEACQAFETPVTGGNVSLFNETDGKAIHPTPVIGMVGVIDDIDFITGHAFQEPGDAILQLGDNTDEIGASEYLYRFHDGLVAGHPPSVDLLAERSLQQAVLSMIRTGRVRSAHDCAEGGLAVALVESALGEGDAPVGVDVELPDALPAAPLFFGEAQGRIVVSCADADADALIDIAKSHGVPVRRIGTVTDASEGVRIRGAGTEIFCRIASLAEGYFQTLPSIMDAAPVAAARDDQ
ncbi:phosphoribosylformylglycinamidine synthase subunit PurL [Gaopeijia maritima]|uniref:Phosphoribosylformylglycinamidine synthase subunit PurL n=1 Tax=Gaopeijia maritima TaxID=3119007 RepID=A0ABU9EA65_9BACT